MQTQPLSGSCLCRHPLKQKRLSWVHTSPRRCFVQHGSSPVCSLGDLQQPWVLLANACRNLATFVCLLLQTATSLLPAAAAQPAVSYGCQRLTCRCLRSGLLQEPLQQWGMVAMVAAPGRHPLICHPSF